MNVFDFDNTVYRGESPLDFVLFMIRCRKKIILFLPKILFYSVRYKLCLATREQLETFFHEFLCHFSITEQELDRMVRVFWHRNLRKLDSRMLRRIRQDDVIITAGPDFLIGGIAGLLNTRQIIASETDIPNSKVTYFNFGENKAQRYRALFGSRKIRALYTDSYNDRALMEYAERVYLVRKGRIRRIR